jgi:hypothetical protein
MLSLSEIQKGHHGCLLVLGRVAFEDLIDELVVLLCELEGNAGIVLGGISMLGLELLGDVPLLWKMFELKWDSRHEGHRWPPASWL